MSFHDDIMLDLVLWSDFYIHRYSSILIYIMCIYIFMHMHTLFMYLHIPVDAQPYISYIYILIA